MVKSNRAMLESKRDVRDMMVSAYSMLRDSCRRRNGLLECIELGLAVFICGMTFFNYARFDESGNLALIIGFVSIAVFALSLIRQRLDYKTLAERYNRAAECCYEARRQIDLVLQEYTGELPIDVLAAVGDKVEQICSDIERIPDSKFVKLKFKHRVKVAFSRYVSDSSESLWLLCKLRFTMSRDVRCRYLGLVDDAAEPVHEQLAGDKSQ